MGVPDVTLAHGAQTGHHLTQNGIILHNVLPNKLVAPINATTSTDGHWQEHLSGYLAFRLWTYHILLHSFHMV